MGSSISGSTNPSASIATPAENAAPGRIGQALKFDGTDDYVDLEASSSLKPSSVTVSAWVDLDSSFTDTYPKIIDGDNDSYGYQLMYRTVGNVGFEFSTGNGTAADPVDSILTTKDKWVHVVGVHSGTYNYIYLNGAFVASAAASTIDYSGVSTFEIGNRGTDARHWKGGIDDVRIYNRALSADEIKRLYALGNTTHIATTLDTQPTLDTGLVGHWTFDGKDMYTNVKDTSGAGNNGDLILGASGNTSTTTGPGPIGQALKFDGTDDGVNVGNPSVLNDLGPMSLSEWVYLNPSGAGTAQKVLGKDGGSSGYWYLEFDDTAPEKRAFDFAKKGATVLEVVSSNGAYEYGKWYHAVATWDGSTNASGVKLYLNGTQITSLQKNQNGVSLASDAANPFYISNPGDHPINGLEDDVRVYNRVLSADEIKRLYALGNTTHIATTLDTQPVLNDGLIGHWTFDGKDMYTNVKDTSGQGNNGNLKLGASGNTATTTGPGRIGQALKFDGANDYVILGTASSLDLGDTSLTLAGWVNMDAKDGANRWIVTKEGTSGHRGWTLRATVDYLPMPFAVGVSGDGSTITTRVSATIPETGKWYYVVGVYDKAAQTLHMYVNGVLDDGALYGTVPSSLNEPSAAPYIGARSGDSEFFNGSLDDVRIYNRALSADEIKRLYQLGAL